MKNLDKMTPEELMREYACILRLLKTKNVIRTNNIVGEYAEYLVQEILDLKLMPNSKEGYDAKDSKGVRYQIKGRYEKDDNPCGRTRELSIFRNLKKQMFDYAVVIIFGNNFTVKEAYKITYAFVEKYSKWKEYRKGHILIAKGEILNKKGCEDITDFFK